MSKPQTIIVPQDDRTRRVTVILYEAERTMPCRMLPPSSS